MSVSDNQIIDSQEEKKNELLQTLASDPLMQKFLVSELVEQNIDSSSSSEPHLFYHSHDDDDDSSFQILNQILQEKEYPLKVATSQLMEKSQHLNSVLKNEMITNQNGLLSQMKYLSHIQEMLESTTNAAKNMQSAVEHVQNEVSQTYTSLHKDMQVLERIQETTDLLRKISLFLKTAQKLQICLQSGPRYLANAAQLLLELEGLRKKEQERFSGIQVIDNQVKNLAKTGEDLMHLADQILKTGINNSNQSEISTALHVFFNLKKLSSKVAEEISALENRAKLAMETSLSERGLDDLVLNKETTEQTKNLIWSRLEKLFENLFSCTIQTAQLQRCLIKLQDPQSKTSFLEFLMKENCQQWSIFQTFWINVCSELKRHFDSVIHQKRGTLQEVLESDFPKLFRVFSEFEKRLSMHYEFKQQANLFTKREQVALYNAISTFKSTFLNTCLQKLNNSVDRTFKVIPSNEETLYILSLFSQEITAVRPIWRVDQDSASQPLGDLSPEVAQIAAKAILRIQDQLSSLIGITASSSNSNTSLWQVGEVPSARQKNMFQGLGCCALVSSGLVDMIHGMTSAVQTPILDASVKVEEIGKTALRRLFENFAEQTEKVLCGIHNENFFKQTPSLEPELPSRYLSQLTATTEFFVRHFVSPIARLPWLAQRLEATLEKISWSYVRQISLVRPVSELGRLKLASEISEFALTLSTFNFPLHNLPVWKILMGLKPLLCTETDKIEGLKELDVIPPSVVLHHIISRAESALVSPHVFRNLSISQYSQWLDTSTEDEIWHTIQDVLNFYARETNKLGKTQFIVEYPLLLKLAPELLKKWNK